MDENICVVMGPSGVCCRQTADHCGLGSECTSKSMFLGKIMMDASDTHEGFGEARFHFEERSWRRLGWMFGLKKI